MTKKRRNVSKKAERKLRLCRKETKCTLRMSSACDGCAHKQFCLDHRTERESILRKEKKAHEQNVRNVRKLRKKEMSSDYELYDDDKFVFACEECETCEGEPFVCETCEKFICGPFQYACPLRDACTGESCLYTNE